MGIVRTVSASMMIKPHNLILQVAIEAKSHNPEVYSKQSRTEDFGLAWIMFNVHNFPMVHLNVHALVTGVATLDRTSRIRYVYMT